MGLLRHHHDDSAGPIRYRMLQKVIAIGDDFWIDDESERHAFKVNGKAARVRDTFVLEDADGHAVARIKEKVMHVRDTMTIDLGDRSATVKKALVGIRDRFHVEVDGADDLKVHGNVVDHEYELEQGGSTIATVSKRWFRVRDTYGVEVQPSADAALVLAVTVAIDDMTHD